MKESRLKSEQEVKRLIVGWRVTSMIIFFFLCILSFLIFFFFYLFFSRFSFSFYVSPFFGWLLFNAVALRKTMVRAHRQAVTWQDEWVNLTMEDIREIERQTQAALAKKMGGATDDVPESADQETSTVPRFYFQRHLTLHISIHFLLLESSDLNKIDSFFLLPFFLLIFILFSTSFIDFYMFSWFRL